MTAYPFKNMTVDPFNFVLTVQWMWYAQHQLHPGYAAGQVDI